MLIISAHKEEFKTLAYVIGASMKGATRREARSRAPLNFGVSAQPPQAFSIPHPSFISDIKTQNSHKHGDADNDG